MAGRLGATTLRSRAWALGLVCPSDPLFSNAAQERLRPLAVALGVVPPDHAGSVRRSAVLQLGRLDLFGEVDEVRARGDVILNTIGGRATNHEFLHDHLGGQGANGGSCTIEIVDLVVAAHDLQSGGGAGTAEGGELARAHQLARDSHHH